MLIAGEEQHTPSSAAALVSTQLRLARYRRAGTWAAWPLRLRSRPHLHLSARRRTYRPRLCEFRCGRAHLGIGISECAHFLAERRTQTAEKHFDWSMGREKATSGLVFGDDGQVRTAKCGGMPPAPAFDAGNPVSCDRQRVLDKGVWKRWKNCQVCQQVGDETSGEPLQCPLLIYMHVSRADCCGAG